MIGNKINDNFHNNAELWKKDYKWIKRKHTFMNTKDFLNWTNVIKFIHFVDIVNHYNFEIHISWIYDMGT